MVKQSQFAQAALKIIPRFDAGLARAAFGFSLIGAEEDVAPDAGQFQIRGAFGQAGGRFG